jgi:aquaporin NIP
MLLKRLTQALAELIGTFALVFAGTGTVMVMERFPGSHSPAVVPLVFGLVVAAMIYALGHISGAHFNPAVTLGFALARHFPWRKVFLYWGAQLLGAILATFLLKALLPPGELYGATVPALGLGAALGWEIMLTFFLMLVITAVATDTRAVGTMAGAAIGATVMFCAFLGGPLTGASMNPARSLGPALAQGELGTLWIYFLGPCVGAGAAALLYEWIRCEQKTKDTKGCC